FYIIFLFLFLIFNFSYAGEVDILMKKLIEKGIISKDEAEQIKNEIKKEKEKEKEKYDFLKNTKFSGDIRVRYQNEDIEGSPDRDRYRIRARWGFKTKISENTEIGLRLATGTGEQTSTNQTFGEAFSQKSFWLDRAYLKHNFNDFGLIAGKIENPFYTTDIIWDSDINPEGLAFIYKNQKGLFINSGIFPLAEFKNLTDDPFLYGIQLGYGSKIGNEVEFKIATSIYTTKSLKGKKQSEISPKYEPKGNTLESNGKYIYEYKPFDIILELTPFKIAEKPFTLYADYLKNIESGVREDKGYLIGFSIGKLKEKNDWKFEYNYRKIDADATLAIFSDSDINGGGTDLKGHKIGFVYQVNKNSSFGITYFIGKSLGVNRTDNRNTLQIDYLVKF
ncbi:MAG TPA: putative porin, partial [bacterium]|nr:putative porin [bacterium]